MSLCADDGLVCIPHGHLHSDINQVSNWYNNSPDDGHMAARNMDRIEINIYEKLYVKLVIHKGHNRIRSQHNMAVSY